MSVGSWMDADDAQKEPAARYSSVLRRWGEEGKALGYALWRSVQVKASHGHPPEAPLAPAVPTLWAETCGAESTPTAQVFSRANHPEQRGQPICLCRDAPALHSM